MLVGFVAVQNQLNIGRAVLIDFEHAFGSLFTQSGKFVKGLSHIHINGIKLLHNRQTAGLIGRHQGTRRDFRQRDTSGNRASDFRVVQINLSSRKRCLCCFHIGNGYLIIGRTTHCIDLHKFGGTLGISLGRSQVGTGLQQRGFCRSNLRLIERRVNTIE